MMLQTAINGVRKEYMDIINILKPTIMRYPDGCFIDSLTAGKVKIVMSEWWNKFSDAYSIKHSSKQEIAIHNACMLNFFQQKSDRIEIANRSTFVEISKNYSSQFKFFLGHSAYVFSLYSNYGGNQLLNTEVVSPTYSMQRSFGNIPLMSSILYLDVSTTKTNNKIYNNVVNRSLEDITTTININGGEIEFSGIIRTINGTDFLSNNFELPHGNVTLVTSQINNAGKSFIYIFPANSVTGIELTEKTTGVKSNFENENNVFLFNAYPNPFNASTTITYTIPTSPFPKEFLLDNPSPYQGERNKERLVTLKVYDILGREVATLVNEYKLPGTYNAQFPIINNQISSGVYFYRLQAGEFFIQKKMMVIK